MPGKCYSVLFWNKKVLWAQQGKILISFTRGQCQFHSYLDGIIKQGYLFCSRVIKQGYIFCGKYTYVLGPWRVSCLDLQALSLENTLLAYPWSAQVVSAISSTIP